MIKSPAQAMACFAAFLKDEDASLHADLAATLSPLPNGWDGRVFGEARNMLMTCQL
jgi:hypothetical protein